MSRFDDEAFESMISGETPEPSEIADDAALSRRLSAHRAVRARLRRAFEGVSPDAAFAAKVRGCLTSNDRVSLAAGRRGVRIRRLLWPVLAAAALVAATAIPLSVLLHQQPAMAAQREFAEIHRGHESGMSHLVPGTDVAEMAAYLRSKLGYEPGNLRLQPSHRACGCCVDRFLGEEVGSYVLQMPEGLVSLIVARAAPETLNLQHRLERDGRTIWACAYEGCQIAGLRSGEVSYYVVGELPHETLIALLLEIVPSGGNGAGQE